ncbi:5-formyltetrahydrofolate cyclo-ligase [Loktanella atrilutea]|uniref:5-formyltetrahydrofolate cyclo-ligase n=1 Tax=Loktanella atrilutea TaxID=366533 RepID=A0A1M5ECQ3_LOKAT|nr:5-formyltetrahydrofolate cyclo-ligase [Loktanella atrilutea]
MDDETNGGTTPCFAHLLVDGHLIDPDTARDVARFRRAERARLIAARALASGDRDKATSSLIEGLDRTVALETRMTIAMYWPIRGEPDLRPWMHHAHAAGHRILLPVITEEHAPLEFRTWSLNSRMIHGFWNILVPAEGETLVPELVIAPLVGFDDDFYRLGNGGGYYDRTLVRLDPQPRVIGVGFSGCRLPSIFPMPWDVPMTEILLSDGTHLKRQLSAPPRQAVQEEDQDK